MLKKTALGYIVAPTHLSGRSVLGTRLQLITATQNLRNLQCVIERQESLAIGQEGGEFPLPGKGPGEEKRV